MDEQDLRQRMYEAFKPGFRPDLILVGDYVQVAMTWEVRERLHWSGRDRRRIKRERGRYMRRELQARRARTSSPDANG